LTRTRGPPLRLRRLAALAVVAAAVLSLAAVPPALGATSSQAEAQIGAAYAAVLAAEQAGGNVTSMVAKLNAAVALVQRADLVNSTDPALARSLYSNASALAAQVAQEAPAVAASGRASVLSSQVDLGVETAVLAALAVAAYVFTPRLFWGLWARAHRGWKVKRR
jgi:hypothetical protein